LPAVGKCGESGSVGAPPLSPSFGDRVGLRLDDQARVLTPREAIAAGATYLVVGRPILEAPDPAQAAAAIVSEIGGPG